MAELTGTRTHQHLIEAFSVESQANRRYVWFAQQADIDGYPEVAALFRSVAEAETGHTHDLLEFLAAVGDPVTGEPIGETDDNLRAAVAGETDDSARRYPRFAEVAREEGFDEVADWFESLARAEQGHADRFTHGLEHLR